jgi:two-component system, chemotaxis family, chemotaxis protein CheY
MSKLLRYLALNSSGDTSVTKPIMRLLIVEDDFTSRRIIRKLVSKYGDCDIAVDGNEALLAYETAWEKSMPYDAILLDICLPKMDGLKVLKRIRTLEKKRNSEEEPPVKIIMTTAKEDSKNVMAAIYKGGASGYLTKPISRFQLEAEFKKAHLRILGDN